MNLSTLSDNAQQFAIYVFRSRDNELLLKQAASHLSWQRENICTTMESAMTCAAMAKDQDGVKRVQIYELFTDASGMTRTGRIVKTLGEPWWKRLITLH